MTLKRNEIIFATGFYSGFAPIAKGTFGSIFAFLFYLIPGFENPYFIIPLILITFFYGVKVCSKMEDLLGKDPGECTIDEFVGTWISLLFLPKKMEIILIAFLIWRILDILKPQPAKFMEKFERGWGVMLDDVVSGFYTALILHFALYAGIFH